MPPKANCSVDIRPDDYDRTSAFLTSLVILTATIVATGVMIWLMYQASPARKFDAVAMDQAMDFGETDQLKGVSDSFEIPGDQDFPEKETPQLERALELATQLPSRVEATLNRLHGEDSFTTGGFLGGRGGDPQPKPNNPWKRWVFEYKSKDILEYKNQLDYFDIEIGVVSKTTERIDLISNVVKTAKVDQTVRRDEKRVYFTHSSATFLRWDQKIAGEVGIGDLENRFMVQFLNKELTEKLTAMELKYAKEKGINLDNVSRTKFGFRAKDDEFEVYIIEMK